MSDTACPECGAKRPTKDNIEYGCAADCPRVKRFYLSPVDYVDGAVERLEHEIRELRKELER